MEEMKNESFKSQISNFLFVWPILAKFLVSFRFAFFNLRSAFYIKAMFP